MSTTATTPIEFTDIEDGEYRYSGVAQCIYHRGSMDRYSSYGWVQGEPSYVEVVDVVLFKVEHLTPWGFWMTLAMVDDAEPLVKLDAAKAVEADEDWQVVAVDFFTGNEA